MTLIQYISRIRFEFGAISLLAEELARLDVVRPMVITDPGIVESGILERVLEAAKPIRPALYTKTTENPTEASLDACLALWNEHGCDGAIGVGGGSSIDLAKAVALLVSHGGCFADYAVNGGRSELIGAVAPHISIPTAAGTGAEVGRACVLTTHDGRKTVAVNLNMVARTILCDPELTFSLSPELTAATGIDALSHGVESLLSPVVNPPAGAIALDCVGRAARWLPLACEDGRNREARWNMMMAALEGGLCLQKGLGAAHAMATPLGELGHRHGELIGVLLPHAVRFNRQAAGKELAELKGAVGLSEDEELDHWLSAMAARIGLPGRLSEMGVERGTLQAIAARAADEHLARTNPRRGTIEDYHALLEAAF